MEIEDGVGIRRFQFLELFFLSVCHIEVKSAGSDDWMWYLRRKQKLRIVLSYSDIGQTCQCNRLWFSHLDASSPFWVVLKINHASHVKNSTQWIGANAASPLREQQPSRQCLRREGLLRHVRDLELSPSVTGKHWRAGCSWVALYLHFRNISLITVWVKIGKTKLAIPIKSYWDNLGKK